MLGCAIRGNAWLAASILCLFCAPAFSQNNLTGKPGLVYSPHPFVTDDSRFVSTVTFTPADQSVNFFISEYSDEVMVSGFLPLNDRLFLNFNLTYLPELADRVGIGDRHLDLSWLVVKEKGGWLPSLMLTVTAPLGQSSFLSQDLLVVGKSMALGSGSLSLSVGYASPFFLYGGKYVRKKEFGVRYLSGGFAGLTYRPIPALGLQAEIHGSSTHLSFFYLYEDKISLKINWLELQSLGFQMAVSFPLGFKPREMRRYEN